MAKIDLRAGTAPTETHLTDAKGVTIAAYATDVLTAAGMPPERWGRERLRSLTDGERTFCCRILKRFAAGASPGPDELADAASELGLELGSALERLARADLVHRDPETGGILVAYPFSGRPTAHRVRFDGRERYATCAIDALGIPFMLGVPAEIESRDPVAGDAISVRIGPRAGAAWSPHAAVVVAGAEAGKAPSSITSYPFINFFASEEGASRYLAATPSLRGAVLSIPEAIKVGRIVFGNLLEVGSRTVAV